MKILLPLLLSVAWITTMHGQTSSDSAHQPPASSEKLKSQVYVWDTLPVTKTPLGERRNLFDAPTDTLAKLHGHITTLNPGERSGEPRKHVQEEVIIVKEGVVEANWDGQSQIGGPGSVIFFAAGATTFLRNPGKTPATYIVLNYYPTLPPKG